MKEKPVSADDERRTLIVNFLRQDLCLTGAHVSCDTRPCGARTMRVNGAAPNICSTSATEAHGVDVARNEGQSNADGSLNVIRQAFLSHHGL